MTDNKKIPILWTAAGALALGLLFARAVYPEYLWLTVALAVALIATLGGLIHFNRQALRGRATAYGLNSAVMAVLVIAIVGVLNFLSNRYPGKLDLTKNKLHTLSDQTVKVVKGLQKQVKAIYFSKIGQREQVRPLLDNLKGYSTKLEVEYVDPDKEPTRAKQAGIKKYGTLQLVVGARDQKIEDPNEEKITNAMIKLLKDKPQTLCPITGHGEKGFNSTEADGFEAVKKALNNQSYEIKEVNLIQDAQNSKVPEVCDAIAILGATKAFFEPEIKILRDYLANGGRGLIAVDINIKGGDFAPELTKLLEEWYVRPSNALIVDPLSRMLGGDAAVPILATYSKDSPVTKDFQGNSFFPFARPLEAIPGAPAGLNVQWLAQTTPKSWAETGFNELATGQVKMDPGSDKAGPLSTVFAVEGKQKDSKATRNTRLVVFGTSHFATNNYQRYGNNLDFFMNAASWVMEDESLISIRAKEEGPGKVELSQKAGTTIFLLTVVIIPILVAAAGIVIWTLRRRL